MENKSKESPLKKEEEEEKHAYGISSLQGYQK